MVTNDWCIRCTLKAQMINICFCFSDRTINHVSFLIQKPAVKSVWINSTFCLFVLSFKCQSQQLLDGTNTSWVLTRTVGS